jgi:predicted nucleic acid-binding protein
VAGVAANLLDVILLPGVVLPGKRSYLRVFALYVRHRGLSFADCCHAVMVDRYHLDGIISFDQGFDRLPDLNREEPNG